MPKGFGWLILAQSFGVLADNALLILGVFFLQEQGYPGWWAPLLKFSLTLSYVLMASVVGPLADAFAKSHVMLVMTAVKILAVCLLLGGYHPLLVFALTGFAASVYAPAKYGLLVETVAPQRLTSANAWLEIAALISLMGGVVLVGWLMDATKFDDEVLQIFASQEWPSWLVRTELTIPFLVVIVILGLSALMNIGVLAMKAKVHQGWLWREVHWTSFWHFNRRLWSDPLGGLSLRVTALGWGVGAVLQFAVLVWAQSHAQMSIQSGAYLQGLVALGVIGGACMAASNAQGFKARKSLWWGLVLAILLPCLAMTHDLFLAIPMLMLAGWSGGMLLIPMNALLQKRGKRHMPPGRSIAVQGFNENLSVLLMLAVYSALLSWDWPLLLIMVMASLPLWIVATPCLQSFSHSVWRDRRA